MTKTLTEQWKDGSFKFGVYYCQTKDDGILKLELCHEGDGHGYAYCYGEEECYRYEDIEEVLAPVPDYQTWKDFQQHFVDKLELEVKLKKAYEQLEQESIKVVELQEQLKEANKLLKTAGYGSKENTFPLPYVCPEECRNYLKKWGVK